MQHDPMYLLALAHDHRALHLNIDSIAALTRRLGCGRASLIGAWCDAETLRHPPGVLVLPCERVGVRPAAVEQTISVSGLWSMLCVRSPTFTGAPSWRRLHEAVVTGLLTDQPCTPSPRYRPVFSAGLPEPAVTADVTALAAAWPHVIGGPLYYSCVSGRFIQRPDAA